MQDLRSDDLYDNIAECTIGLANCTIDTPAHGATFMNILVIDDDSSLRRTVRMSLEVLGHHATEARDSTQALELLSRRPFDTALLDLRLAQEQGLDLLPRLLSMAPGLHVVVVTAYATIETAVEAMRRGAFDYLPKPFTPDQLRIVLGADCPRAAAAVARRRAGRADPQRGARSRLADRGAEDARGPRRGLHDGRHGGHDP